MGPKSAARGLLSQALASAGLVGLLGLLGALGCSDDKGPSAPRPPNVSFAGGGTTTQTGGASANTGGTLTGDGGMEPDGGGTSTTVACRSVAPAQEPGEGAINNSVQSPADFEVTRVSIGVTGGCDAPKITIAMSGGRCPSGDGHELTFEFDALAADRGDIPGGQLDLADVASSGQVRVTYSRPNDLSPFGDYGTCTTTSGLLGLTSPPSTQRNSTYSGSYQMTLNACAGSSGPPQDVQGTFTATLGTALDRACPPVEP